MFDNLETRAEAQQGQLAGQPLINASNTFIDQSRQDFADSEAAQAHAQNLALLADLRELDEAIDVPGIVESFNAVAADVSEYRNWQMKATGFSWLPLASVALQQQHPVEGVRALRAWRLHWDSQKESASRRPSDTLIALYQRQEQDQLLPPRAAVISGNGHDTLRPPRQPKPVLDIIDDLQRDCFSYFEYYALRRFQAAHNLSPESDFSHPAAIELAARAWALESNRDRNAEPRGVPAYYEDVHGNVWNQKQHILYGNLEIAGDYYKGALKEVVNNSGFQYDRDHEVAAQNGISASEDAPYQSFMHLGSVNRHFAPASGVTLGRKYSKRRITVGKGLGRIVCHMPSSLDVEVNQGVVDAHSWEIFTAPELMLGVRDEIGKRLGNNYAHEAELRSVSSGQPV